MELIALEKYVKEEIDLFFGAVTTGDLWKFGTLDRAGNKITKDINSYRVSADVQDIFSILTHILQ